MHQPGGGKGAALFGSLTKRPSRSIGAEMMKKEKYAVNEDDDAPLVPRFGVALQFCLPTLRDSCSTVSTYLQATEHAIARRTAQLIQNSLASADSSASPTASERLRLCGGVLR